MMFLEEPGPSPARDRLYEQEIEDTGYLMNQVRAWAWQPAIHSQLWDLIGAVSEAAGLSFRQRALIVSSVASGIGDSYCSYAWGARLADAIDVDTAVGVVSRGEAAHLPEEDSILVVWGRQLARDPSGTTSEQVAALRRSGFDDAGILAMTLYAALRIAFSTVNDALGAPPDNELVEKTPEALRAVIDFGRQPGS